MERCCIGRKEICEKQEDVVVRCLGEVGKSKEKKTRKKSQQIGEQCHYSGSAASPGVGLHCRLVRAKVNGSLNR